VTDHWTSFALDEAFKGIREDVHEVRDEAKAVSDKCHNDHKEVMARLDKQDSARDAARLETRKAILAFAGVLLGAIIAAGAAIVVALLAGGPA
jgi:hypothetical protein